jgi:hypothetical protein
LRLEGSCAVDEAGARVQETAGNHRPSAEKLARTALNEALVQVQVAYCLAAGVGVRHPELRGRDRDCGHKVLEASAGDEAVRILSSPAVVEIVFWNVQVPGQTDGFALAQGVRRERPGIKVVLTSGVTRAVEAAGHICDDGPLICKPYEPAQVEQYIRRLLAAADRVESRNQPWRRA